jgi:hypothetical protein
MRPARDQGERGLPDIGGGEKIRRPQILRRDDELRADDAGEDAAEQHPGNRLGPERLARGIGGGEAI